MLFHQSNYLESLPYQEKKKKLLKKAQSSIFSYLIFISISAIAMSSPNGVFTLFIESKPWKPGMILFLPILKKLTYLAMLIGK